MVDHVEISTVILIKCTEDGQGLPVILCTAKGENSMVVSGLDSRKAYMYVGTG